MKKLLLIISMTTMAFCVPAYEGKIEFKHQNGSTFKGYLKGDEYFSWIEDEKKNIVIFNENSKNYEYAKIKYIDGVKSLIPSGIKAGTSLNQFFIIHKTLMDMWSKKREERKYHN